MQKRNRKGSRYPLLCLAMLILAATSVHAQINTENLRKGDLRKGLHHTLTLDYNLVSGNSEFYSLTGGYRVDHMRGATYTFGVIEYQRGNEDEEDFINKGFFHLRLIRRLNQRLRGELFAQNEYNDFILLENRILFGGGLRIDLLSTQSAVEENRPVRLYAGVGAMWEREKLGTSPATETRFYRSTNYATFLWQVDEGVTLNMTGYYQFRFRDIEDYRILIESGFGFDLTASLAFQVSLNVRFDSEPPTGVKRHDLDFSNGVRFSF